MNNWSTQVAHGGEDWDGDRMPKRPSLFLMLSAIATIATFPLYIFASGGAQPSHGFFILFCMLFHRELLQNIMPESGRVAYGPMRAAFCFVFVVFVVQLIYGITLESAEMLKYIAFISFNFGYLVVMYRYIVTYRTTALNHVFIGMLLAVGLALLGVMLNIGPNSGRQTGFFNNPNQLGYFGLIDVMLFLACYSVCTLKYARILALAGISASIYLILVSLSKAALVSSFFGLLLFAPSIKGRDLAFLGVLCVVTLPFVAPKIIESNVVSRVVARIQNIGHDRDDSIAGRGYNRIKRHPEKLILGAGEGEYHRFGARLEMHSTVGNIVFCYGLAGALFFALFNLRCLKASPQLFISIFAPLYAYGMTHNGIRFSAFWLAYAVFLAICELQRNDEGDFEIDTLSWSHLRDLVPGSRKRNYEPDDYDYQMIGQAELVRS
ncbi:hypothetical protein [Roseiconus lacunae]|uniref:O-antigen ligase domain-containing protein n=1 Tax=Roseiconus lacunae TaxID=2605694 RepID=A0ABT7PFL3_9BACT|nr:hypothetical protein [Roseiconus lacunae]MDM4015026.1 hypothetical protein [Roseiconus lacunae]